MAENHYLEYKIQCLISFNFSLNTTKIKSPTVENLLGYK